MSRRSQPLFVLAAGLLLLGCSESRGSSGQPGGADPQSPPAPKRMVAAMRGEPNTLYLRLNSMAASVPGSDALEDIVNAGLSVVDVDQALRPQLAEAVPSIESGQWVLLADGRMETTWTLRPGTRWHDGVPYTTQDLLFTATLARDPELTTFSDPAYSHVESLEAPDARTLLVRWARPFIEADRLFNRRSGLALPRHLLEPLYLESKAGFAVAPYWTDEFVGAGPYRLREFVRGSHLVLEALDSYVLGRPKIDVLEVKFITNTSTMASNLLSGAVDLTLGRALSLDEAIQVRDLWRDGRMEARQSTLIRMYPELLHPEPPVVANPVFRQALVYAMDRQELITTLQAGMTSIAYTILADAPRFREIQASVARYDYDPRRAEELTASLGYSKGPDGVLRSSAGERLTPVEIRAPATADLQVKMMHPISEYWNRVGVPTELALVPVQRVNDREYYFHRTGFHLVGGSSGFEGIYALFHSSQIPTPRSRYAGTNQSHYANPEVDALIDRFLVTIPLRERFDVLGQIMRQVVDDVALITLFFNVETTMIANHLRHAAGRSYGSTQGWNAHEWELQ